MIAAIILTAGLSSRTKGSNKLLLNYKGKKIIKHSVKSILNSKINHTVVVLGKNKEKIKKEIPKSKNISFVYNSNYKQGMASSIIAGINSLPKETTFFFISLADMPEIKSIHYNKMITASKKNPKLLIVPFYKSQQANPVLFPIDFKNKLATLKGDRGAKKILAKSKIKKIIFTSNAFIKDLDTLEDFNKKL
ncbi:nucleotidyltransferase family protein [Pelagibacteraceae bacterium]|nr:nucleotidyltransferase family protein [Pelagibacteraceae bacterium]